MGTPTAVLPETPSRSALRTTAYPAAVAGLLVVFAIELLVPASRQSAAFDEGCHTLAGYSYWMRGDFGVNPEHPPLVKLLATLPLLSKHLRYPAPGPIPFFKLSCFTEGRDFLYANTITPDSILLRTRVAAASLSLFAALLTFAFAYELFGRIAALVALALFVFEPNLVAHGALVTTDMGMALFLLASVYAFHRYVKKPSLLRLAVVGIVVGLALAAKHSAIIVLPVVCVLASIEFFLHEGSSKLSEGGKFKHALRLSVSVLSIGAISIAVLWSFYGFRFAARPDGQPIIPPFGVYVQQVPHPVAGKIISGLGRHHLLPEAYLYGVADLFIAPHHFTSYLFGKLYRHGQPFYFPAVLVIKSTIGLLLLLILLPLALAIGAPAKWRDLLFLFTPPLAYFAAAINSGFNIGVRHILPMYPFLVILAAFSFWQLGRVQKAWMYAVSALLLFHAASSAYAFPNYIPYSNEIWGGSSQTYKVLTDSNVDWGQQLKQTKTYIDDHNVKDCWFGYFAFLVADPNYYGIQCKPVLPPFKVSVVPAHISGTVLVSATALSGGGPEDMNPYAPFLHVHPTAEIDDGIFVYRGEFDTPLLSAISHAQAASALLQNPNLSERQLDQALAEAQTAVSLAPSDVDSQVALGDALAKLHRKDESRATYQHALAIAESIHPEFQSERVVNDLKKKLQ